MKRLAPVFITLAAIVIAAMAYVRFTTGSALPAPHDHAMDASIWVCPMHPWIRSTTAGKCTICGMSLVARTPADAAKSASAKNIVPLMPEQVATLGVETTLVAPRPLQRTMRVNGKIEDDETTHRVLSSRVAGRIEKLTVNFVGRPVLKGAAMATIYSPDVLTAERTYLERLTAGAAYAPNELAAAREKLFQLGLIPDEISELESTKEPSALISLRAPADGSVISRYVYEGQYVAAGDKLFEIGDFTKMWFMFDAYEADMPFLAVGQMVEVTSDALAGEKLYEPITFINPNFDMMTRTAKVRVTLNDPHVTLGDLHIYLPHGVLATGVVKTTASIMLTIPRTAVLDTGSGPYAYVDVGGNAYERRPLYLGRKGDNFIEVVDGVKDGEKVVSRAALLIDAQSKISGDPEMEMDTPVAPNVSKTTEPQPPL